jgi:hypothetical protein
MVGKPVLKTVPSQDTKSVTIEPVVIEVAEPVHPMKAGTGDGRMRKSV